MADSRKRRHMNNSDETSSSSRFEGMSGYRFLIPSKAAGAMIGRGGEIINRLRLQHNCRITVPDNKGPERIVIIDGSPSVVLGVWSDILPYIQEYMIAKDFDFEGSSRYIEGDDEIDLRLIVHESQVGAVIGKGGERIRKLIDKHGMTIIKLYKKFCPNSTDRIVRMVSRIGNVINCLENIFNLLENQVIKGSRKDYNPDNYDESAAPDYGGYLIKDPKFSRRSSFLNNHLSGRQHFPDDRFTEPVEESVMRQIPNSFPPSSHMHNNNFDDHVQGGPLMYEKRNYPNERRDSYEVFDGTIRLNLINDHHNLHVSRMAVPKQLVSAVVGKDGQRLHELRIESGAAIEIEVDRMNYIEDIFIVRGTPDQIYKAQCLIQLCARKFHYDDGF